MSLVEQGLACGGMSLEKRPVRFDSCAAVASRQDSGIKKRCRLFAGNNNNVKPHETKMRLLFALIVPWLRFSQLAAVRRQKLYARLLIAQWGVAR